MIAIGHSVISRRGRGDYGGFSFHGLGALPTCPSADVSSLLELVNYCNIAGVGLTACPGQDLASIQAYNMQLQTDANNALNQCNCNNAWVLNGKVGPNSCASMYPVSGTTKVVAPSNVPVVPSGGNTVTNSTQSVQSRVSSTQTENTNTVPVQSTTVPNATTGTSSTSTSTNAGSQTDTSGTTGGISLSGFQIIVGVIGVGLALMALQKGH